MGERRRHRRPRRGARGRAGQARRACSTRSAARTPGPSAARSGTDGESRTRLGSPWTPPPSAPVPRPRAGRVPERRDVRAAAGGGPRRAGAGRRAGRARRAARCRTSSGRSRCTTRQREAYAARARRAPRRRRADDLDERGHRARSSPGWSSARGDEIAHERRRSTPACSARCSPRATPRRRRCAPRRSPSCPSAVGPRDDARRVLARRLGPRRRRRAGRARRRSTCRVLLDGAQGVGAVPVDVGALGCAFYAAAGPEVAVRRRRHRDALRRARAGASASRAIGPTYLSFEDPARASSAVGAARRPRATTRRRCRASRRPLRSPRTTCSHALRLGRASTRARASWPPRWPAALAEAGPDGRAARRHDARRVGGRRPEAHARAPRRGRRSRSATCPDTPFLRASVGAWNDESDLERLLSALTPDTRAWRGDRAGAEAPAEAS